ncbi:hypothetical protein JTB14_023385 [Gonioctena quinquepunctata]|nr:hypothetical protein JTB14_023385 [Gonioctena quinquepunctata]
MLISFPQDKQYSLSFQEQGDASDPTPVYMEPSAVNSSVTVIASYDYRSEREDELSFCKHAVITNVNKQTEWDGWWKGDYGGLQQRYFPQNYVREISKTETQDIDEAGCLDMTGVVADYKRNTGQGMDWIVRIVPSTAYTTFECGVQDEELAKEWCSAIHQVTQMASVREGQHRKTERAYKIAKELSDLIIYFQSTSFNLEKAKQQDFIFYEMSSFPEKKADKLICQQEKKFFLKYHQIQFSRVYPNFTFNSANYNPINLWNCGSQMLALNFQTGGRPMQLNQAKFRDNGNCGYLLKPEFMNRDDFDPFDKNTLVGVEPLTISIRIIAGRNLCRSKKGTTSPLIEVEVIGAPFDSGIKLETKSITDNGFNPRWNEDIGEFVVSNPYFSFLSFVVKDLDAFGDSNFIGQATYPVCIEYFDMI